MEKARVMGGTKKTNETFTDQSTSVSTKTTSTVGDVGLTGKDAIELAAIIEAGATARTRFEQDALTRAFIGGAGLLTERLVSEVGPRGPPIVISERGGEIEPPQRLGIPPNTALILAGAGVVIAFIALAQGKA